MPALFPGSSQFQPQFLISTDEYSYRENFQMLDPFPHQIFQASCNRVASQTYRT